MRRRENTGEAMAMAVALETARQGPDRLFADPNQVLFLSPFRRWLLVAFRRPGLQKRLLQLAEAMQPGAYAGIMARKRLIRSCLHRYGGPEMDILILGAGLDALAYSKSRRAGGPRSFIELDLPDLIRKKRRIYRRLGEGGQIRLIGADLEREPLSHVLALDGSERPLFCICEGLFPFLKKKSACRLLEDFGRFPPKSLLLLTYLEEDFLSGRAMMGWGKAYESEVRSGFWQSGFTKEELRDLLSGQGYRLLSITRADQILPGEILRKRGLCACGPERIALAVRER